MCRACSLRLYSKFEVHGMYQACILIQTVCNVNKLPLKLSGVLHGVLLTLASVCKYSTCLVLYLEEVHITNCQNRN